MSFIYILFYFLLLHLTQGCREGSLRLLVYAEQQLSISRIVEILTTGQSFGSINSTSQLAHFFKNGIVIVQSLFLAVADLCCFLQALFQLQGGCIHFAAQLAQLISKCAFKACADAGSLFIQYCFGQIFGVSGNCREDILVEHI